MSKGRLFRHSLTPFFLFALVCLLLPGIFIYRHASTPADGARLDRGMGVFTSEGVALASYGTGSAVQPGDILVAVNGITLHDRAEVFFTGDLRSRVYGASSPIVYTVLRNGELLELEIELIPFPWQKLLRDHGGAILFFLLIQGLVVFILLQRPHDPAAQAFFVWGFSGSHTYIWAVWLQVSDLLHGGSYWFFRFSNVSLWLLFWAAMVHMLLVFPRSLLSASRPAWPWLLGLYASPFLIFTGFIAWQFWQIESRLAWENSWLTGEYVVAVIFMVMGIMLFIRQYLTAQSEVDRIKSRWVIFGGLNSLVLGLGLYFLPSLFFERPLLSPNGLGLINFPFIASLAIAIWRHSLFDINVIIRRTVVYGLLTTFLAFFYLSLVTLLQMLITGSGDEHSSGAIVISTLAIAALFNPLRKRIQNFIDRRFYRQKYNVEQSLADFAAVARSETDLTRLSDELVSVVSETLQPESIDLWLPPEPNDKAG